MAVAGDRPHQFQVLLRARAGRVDREEGDRDALAVRVGGRLDGELDGALDRPAVAELDQVPAGWDLHHDAGHAAVDGALDVVEHAARERVDHRGQPERRDAPDRLLVVSGHRWQAGLDPVHAGLRERLGDPDLVVRGELDAGLLFAVAQRHVVDLDVRRQPQGPGDRGVMVPRAGEPPVRVPGRCCCARHGASGHLPTARTPAAPCASSPLCR